MQVLEKALNGVVLLQPQVFTDNRGCFFESFNQSAFNTLIAQNIEFTQDNHSVSLLNVVRGLHLQAPPFEQGKLVRVVKGKVYDVAVDIRKGSPTFGQHYGVELSAENNYMLWIPPGFAHGFSVLENDSVFLYKCTKGYNKDSERTLLFNDAMLGINWKVDPAKAIVSDKDLLGTPLNQFNSPFEFA